MTVDLSGLSDAEFVALVLAEKARREEARRTRGRAAAYRIVLTETNDPAWTPQVYDGARIVTGPHAGYTGTVEGRCGDGCDHPDDPRWRVGSLAGWTVVTCLPRHLLAPVPTVRRPGAPGRARCDQPCRCCIDPPRSAWTGRNTTTTTNH